MSVEQGSYGECENSEGGGPDLDLTLLPPGGDGVELPSRREELEIGGSTVEIGDTCVVTLMQRMIAQEVHNYFDKSRAGDDSPKNYSKK